MCVREEDRIKIARRLVHFDEFLEGAASDIHQEALVLILNESCTLAAVGLRCGIRSSEKNSVEGRPVHEIIWAGTLWGVLGFSRYRAVGFRRVRYRRVVSLGRRVAALRHRVWVDRRG